MDTVDHGAPRGRAEHVMFIAFTLVGLAAGLAHFPIVGRSCIGPASAMILGIAGGWNGALLADAVTGGHWAFFGAYALAGCIVGAAGAVIGVDAAVEAYLRYDHPLPLPVASQASQR